MKKIIVLGSTGSIGTQTLDIVRYNKDIQVTAMAVGSNIKKLKEQIEEFLPEVVCVYDHKKAEELKSQISHMPVKVVSGMEGLIECATIKDAQIVVTAMVGMIGLLPTVEAIKAGKDIALANKETLVTAGHIIMPLAKKMGVSILPVDSEHSAIIQCLHGENRNQVSKIILTASGGPFRGRKKEELGQIQVEDALKHPNWSMGKKITIDSSTLVNKGLEVMEAKWLFNVNLDQIEVVIQPQSVIHSMVEFADGAVMAQLGTPDMRLPIQYALYYPERKMLPGKRLNFYELNGLTFEAPDTKNFPALGLAYEASRQGGSMPTVFNAANERAVALFLNRQIGYLDIVRIIESSMKNIDYMKEPSIEEILRIEQDTYDFINSIWKSEC